jgi:hypothetical protein
MDGSNLNNYIVKMNAFKTKKVDGYKVVYSESAYAVADTSTLML